MGLIGKLLGHPNRVGKKLGNPIRYPPNSYDLDASEQGLHDSLILLNENLFNLNNKYVYCQFTFKFSQFNLLSNLSPYIN